MSTRPEPEIFEHTRAFWTGGRNGELLIVRCATCRRWQHPPLPVCPNCHGDDLAPEPVSGRGTVQSFTINRYPWAPGIEPPYVLADVELPEQPGLRLLSTILDCDEPRIGLTVEVRFEPAGAAWIPVFVHES